MDKDKVLQKFKKIKEYYLLALGAKNNPYYVDDRTQEVNKFEKDLEEYLNK